MLTKNQFEILECLISSKDKISQRKISSKVSLSIGLVNKIIKDLTIKGYIHNQQITPKGIEALEPYKVKRAVIIASGIGSRLMPVTLSTPKPLVRVKGQRMIDSTLDALMDIGIEEIYIVRGYLGQQFDELLTKYPTIKFINNDKYNEANNISSILFAKDYLTNAYILEADLILYNKELIKKYQYSTNYLAIPVKSTDDWCFYLNNKQYISKVAIGGENCYKMVGISYWSEKDGKQLSEDIEKVWNSLGGKERYWDQVPLEYYKDNYNIQIRKCKQEDIIEIDNFNELKQIDNSYNV